jgi:hypothetical protein
MELILVFDILQRNKHKEEEEEEGGQYISATVVSALFVA